MKFLPYIRLYIIPLLVVVSTSVNSEKVGDILLIGFQEHQYRETIAQIIISRLEQEGHRATSIKTVASGKYIAKKPDIIITAGTRAAEITDKHNAIPILTIIPSAYTDVDKLKSDGNTALLHMTQPICRHIQLISLMNPGWKSIRMLSNDKDFNPLTAYQCANNKELLLYITNVNEFENTLNALNNALRKTDVLLALPSPDIYNTRTIKNILLSSYRNRVPVIGFSENFVNAGALAAVYSLPEQIGEKAADTVIDFFKNNNKFTENNIFPDKYEIKINRQVKRSLDIQVRSIDFLKQNMASEEEN